MLDGFLKWSAAGVMIILIAATTLPIWDHYDFAWSDGGDYHSSLKVQRKKVDFIRDHSCTLRYRGKPREELDRDLNLKHVSGFRYYSCLGVSGADAILIEDYELQP